jgi:outer membrane lipoprotein-sorting protein
MARVPLGLGLASLLWASAPAQAEKPGRPAAPAPAAQTPAPPLDQTLAALERASRSLTSLEGEFVQRNRLKLFAKELVSKGRLAFEQPRRIRWEYTDPDPSVLVLNGARATLTTPGAAPQRFNLDEDATMRAVFDQLLLWFGAEAVGAPRAAGPGGTPAAGSGGGFAAVLSRDYALSTEGSAASPVLVLTPRAGTPVGRAFRRVALRLDGPSAQLVGLTLTEAGGDEKDISFVRQVRNRPLPAGTFVAPE